MKALNTISLNKTSLLHNLTILSSMSLGNYLFLNLKSNAYGHGIKELSSILSNTKIPLMIVVNSLEEALLVNKTSNKFNILISGYVIPQNLKNIPSNISFAVWSLDQCKNITKCLPLAKLHLFIDTGMNREGIKYNELQPDIIKFKKYLKNFVGLMSHFSSADDLKSKESSKQMENYKECLRFLNNNGFNFKYKHLSASSGHIRVLTKDLCNTSRIGLALYGISPLTRSKVKLKPVLSLFSTIIQIKHVNKGDKIGYNATYTATINKIVAVLPIGYADGIPRELSNIGYIKYKGKYCKYLGRISMNLCVVDVSEINNPKVGDKVTIISCNENDKNSVKNIAKTINKIPYQILVGLNSDLNRNIK